MKFFLLVAFLCGVVISTSEARVVKRDRRSFFDGPKKPEFPSIVLVGLVDQPVPTVVGIPQQNPYPGPPPPSYGAQPPPPPYAPPSYSPPSYPPPSHSLPAYAPPPTAYAPQSYMAPPPPYQPPQYAPMSAAPAQMHPPQAQQQLPAVEHQQLPASEPQQHEQSVPVPTEENLPIAEADPPAATKHVETESSDAAPSTELTSDSSKSDDQSNWETSTSSSL